MKNHYEILEIAISASAEQIKKAYRIKAIKYHPDKHLGDKYFTDKFIEIKESYEILINPTLRVEYDLLLREYLLSKSKSEKTTTSKQKKEKEKEEEFFYNPHKSFYSNQDRAVNETPQFNPIVNHWGRKIIDKVDFFKLPTNIGKIISGYSTLFKEEKPPTTKENVKTLTISIVISLIISFAIIWIFNVESNFWLGAWIIAPLLLALGFSSFSAKFEHFNTFIGVNGFAVFKCEGTRKNIVDSYEINFKEITDFVRVTVIQKYNYNYTSTAFSFVWLNGNSTIKEITGSHTSEEGDPNKELNPIYWINDVAERYWTVYLMDKMEDELEKKGYLEFNLYHFDNNKYEKTPFLQLGIGYVKFLSKKGDTIYNFNEIKKMYTKNNNLFIEHSNYEKKFMFFKKGDKNGIPLMNLSNRLFFYRAMELLIGYKIA